MTGGEKEIEIEIKLIAESIFDFNEELRNMQEMNVASGYTERKKDYAQREWLKYKILMAEKRIKFIKGS